MRRLPPVDLAIAAALAAAAQAQIWSSGDDQLMRAAFALLLTLPLAWRRAATVPALGLVLVALLVASLVTAPPESEWTLVAVIVALYSAGSYAALRPSLALVVLASAAVVVNILNDPSDDAANIAPTIVVFVAIPWAAGRVASRT